MQPATPATVLGNFDDATVTYDGVTSTFFRRDDRFFVRTDGPDGAHALKNETNASVRVLIASTVSSPEVCEYPDLGQITAQARTGSLTGDRLWLIHDVDPKEEQ